MLALSYSPEGFWEIFDWITENFIKFALGFMLAAIGLYFISKFVKTLAEKRILNKGKIVEIKVPQIKEKAPVKETK